MTRPENLLFALYALRVSILDRDQFMAICQSLRHGKDVDLGMSLAKRGFITVEQMDALWSLVHAQVEKHGNAKKAISTVEAGGQISLAIHAALKPMKAEKGAPAEAGSEEAKQDPPTVNFEIPDLEA